MYIFFLDNNALMSDFVCQIKSSLEWNGIYELIQRDSSGMAADIHIIPMEVGE